MVWCYVLLLLFCILTYSIWCPCETGVIIPILKRGNEQRANDSFPAQEGEWPGQPSLLAQHLPTCHSLVWCEVYSSWRGGRGRDRRRRKNRHSAVLGCGLDHTSHVAGCGKSIRSVWCCSHSLMSLSPWQWLIYPKTDSRSFLSSPSLLPIFWGFGAVW